MAIGVIPTIRSQQPLDPAPVGPRVSPEEFGLPGRAVASIASIATEYFGELDAKQREARRAAEATQRTAQGLKELADLRLRFDRDPDFATAGPRFEAEARKIRERIGGEIRDDAVRSLFTRDFDRSTLTGYIEVRREAAKREASGQRAVVADSLFTYAQVAASARNPVDRENAIARGRAALAGAMTAGFLTPEEAQKAERGFLSDVDEAGIRGLIVSSPGRAAQLLADATQFPNLDPVKRTQLLATATTRADAASARALALSERQERLAERRLRADADAALNDFYTRMDAASRGDGEMPRVEDLARHRDALSPGEYRAALTALRAPAERDDPGAVAALSASLDSLSPEEFSAAATRTLEARQITIGTFQQMVNANRAARRDDAPPSPYRQGLDLVRNSLDPGQLGDGATRIAFATAQNRAVVDWNLWMRRNPNATEAEALAEADNIVRRYQTVAGGQMRTNLPVPFSFTGDKASVTLDAVAASKANLAAALEAGRISEAEAAQQWRYLEDWEAMLTREAAAPARPTNRRR